MRGRRLRFLLLPLAVLVLLLLAGTIGYQCVEGWDWFDSLYMTVISITTVGFQEVHPLSPRGRALPMVLTVGGVFTAFYAAMEFIRAVVSGGIGRGFGRQGG